MKKTCAKCNKPRYSTSAYCHKHKKEYMLQWTRNDRSKPENEVKRQIESISHILVNTGRFNETGAWIVARKIIKKISPKTKLIEK